MRTDIFKYTVARSLLRFIPVFFLGLALGFILSNNGPSVSEGFDGLEHDKGSVPSLETTELDPINAGDPPADASESSTEAVMWEASASKASSSTTTLWEERANLSIPREVVDGMKIQLVDEGLQLSPSMEALLDLNQNDSRRVQDVIDGFFDRMKNMELEITESGDFDEASGSITFFIPALEEATQIELQESLQSELIAVLGEPRAEFFLRHGQNELNRFTGYFGSRNRQLTFKLGDGINKIETYVYRGDDPQSGAMWGRYYPADQVAPRYNHLMQIVGE
ncbi:MAG: hypothetical protein HRU10_04585 [Opitutales bacterium]|nr:hypothetical protein [Opitutales bacterium]